MLFMQSPIQKRFFGKRSDGQMGTHGRAMAALVANVCNDIYFSMLKLSSFFSNPALGQHVSTTPQANL
jgi:hypothetical protein